MATLMRLRVFPPLSLLLFLLFNPVNVTFSDEFPVAPLSRLHSDTWGEVFHLSNRFVEVTISPDHDGVVSFRETGGTNRLEAPATLLPADPDRLAEALPRLEGIPQARWQARGWISSEGSQTVLLNQSFGPPIHLLVTHLISLPRESPSLLWSTRMTALAPVDPLLPAAFHLPANTLLWDSVWKIENGPELKTAVETPIPHSEKGRLETLAAQPALHHLPPQGWTLRIEGTLRLSESAADAP